MTLPVIFHELAEDELNEAGTASTFWWARWVQPEPCRSAGGDIPVASIEEVEAGIRT